jgi:hypothetical protein
MIKLCNLKTIIILVVLFPVFKIAQSELPGSSISQQAFPPTDNDPEGITADSTDLQMINDLLQQRLNEINLARHEITAVTFDNKGRIWVGSRDGLWVFDGSMFQEFTYKDGLFDKEIHDLHFSIKGNIWAATSGGPFALLNNHFYVFEPLTGIKILNISENATHWLFNTNKGLKTFSKETVPLRSLYTILGLIVVTVIILGAVISWGIRRFKTNIEWKANLIRIEQQALLAQMNPHFIFNSLNSVQRYIMANDKEAAHGYLQKFASMMRKVLENSNQPTIILSEEIASLDIYLQLESLRFDHGFDFEISVADDEIWQIEIPTMLLQTFVENAVWHGLMKKESRGKIDLRFSRLNNKNILCEIEDNGVGRKKAAEFKSKDQIKHKSKGIEIVKKRIELLNLKNRRKIKLETIDLEEKDPTLTGTLVRLTIPVILA